MEKLMKNSNKFPINLSQTDIIAQCRGICIVLLDCSLLQLLYLCDIYYTSVIVQPIVVSASVAYLHSIWKHIQ